MPPEQLLSVFWRRPLRRLRPINSRVILATQSFLEAVADDMSFANRLVMKNLWLFKPLVIGALKGTGSASRNAHDHGGNHD